LDKAAISFQLSAFSFFPADAESSERRKELNASTTMLKAES
jgi:hypothetical protein